MCNRRFMRSRFVFTMSRYKYVVLFIMMALFIYTLCMDVGYPFLDNLILSDIETSPGPITPTPSSIMASSNQSLNASDNTVRYCSVYNVTANYRADFECVKTRTSPAATVCLYPQFTDMYISHDIRETGVWEPQVLHDFMEVMRKDPSLNLLDIGANIGFYTMLALSMGRKALAIEPNVDSIWRIHRAAVLTNTTSQVTILKNGVSDIRTRGTLFGGGDNKGDVRIHPHSSPCLGSCPTTVELIYLDDILEVAEFDRAVLKLDIQGFEHKAMRHASRLLQRMHIPVIFIEWGVMREYHLPDQLLSSDKFLVEEMIRMLFKYGYRPYALSKEGGRPLDPAIWHEWPHDLLWRKMAGNEELEDAMRFHFMNWP